MGIFIAILIFVLILSAITAFGYSHYVKPTRMIDRLTSSTTDVIPSRIIEREKKGSFVAQWLVPIGNLLPISPQDASIARRDLMSAGFRSSSGVAVFLGSKITLCVLLLIAGLIVRQHLTSPVSRLAMPIALAALGYCLPAFILGRLVKRRQEQMRLGLPDVLDLLVICSEAGCGLDQAILNVSRELKQVHPALSEELSMVNMEIMAGQSRAESLRNFARRTGEEEVKKLVAILIQTDKFGTSVADALRTQSDFLRIRRRQEAEERAGKVGVKLVFPIFFFCLPSLMIVTAGPGMLQLFQNLLPVMNGIH